MLVSDLVSDFKSWTGCLTHCFSLSFINASKFLDVMMVETENLFNKSRPLCRLFPIWPPSQSRSDVCLLRFRYLRPFLLFNDNDWLTLNWHPYFTEAAIEEIFSKWWKIYICSEVLKDSGFHTWSDLWARITVNISNFTLNVRRPAITVNSELYVEAERLFEL